MPAEPTSSRRRARAVHSTLVDVLRWRALEHPHRTAVIFLQDGGAEQVRVTYGDLDDEARRVATLLQERAAPGDTALLLYPAGVEFITAFLGCLYAGVVAIPLYPPHPRRTAARLEAAVNDARPRFVLGTASLLAQLHDRVLADSAAVMQPLATDAMERIEPASWRRPPLGAESLAFLQYTSGSTATPRGVRISHANILHNERMIEKAFGHNEDLTVVGWLPLYHDMGLIGNLLQPLFVGARTVLMAPTAFLQRPHVWLQAISTYKAGTSGGPNFAYEMCVRRVTSEQKEGLDLSSWTIAFNGAEPISHATLERFMTAFAGCGFRADAFYPCYGLAEATLLVSANRVGAGSRIGRFRQHALQKGRVVKAGADDADARALVACGHPWLGEELLIVDTETLQACRPGRVGEIWVSGANIAQGYWNSPDATAATFNGRLADGRGSFLRTGDVGFVHAGQLFVAGRLKDLIIVGGRNHHPQDIERTVEASHASLQPGGSAAFSVERDGEERLVVVAEVDRHFRGEAVADAVAAIRQAVAWEHEVEVDAVALLKTGSMFKTSSGKTQRFACRAAFLSRSLNLAGEWTAPSRPQAADPVSSSADRPAPPTVVDVEAITAWLVGRVAARLGVGADAIDVRQPFSSFGLGSLDAVSMTGELATWIGRELSATLLYEQSTIESLATYLAAPPRPREEPFTPHRTASGAEREPLAIVGIGCRFPGASGPEAFWRLLCDGVDAIREVPPERWDARLYYSPAAGAAGRMNTRWGGFLDDVDRFDASFFGIGSREAVHMDPQQRLLLEVTWEALEDAGLPPSGLAGSRTGVFVGIGSSDYAALVAQRPAAVDAYAATGGALSIAANRISYVFDFRGPSLAVDTACSSSLVAIHLAGQSLRSGESTLAVAGGVNLTLTPATTISFAQAGATSPDGRCKTFDARANGIVRSEGAGVVVLKRLSDAIAGGDRVYAVIQGSAVNQDGRSNGLTAPNPAAQHAVLAQAYRDAGVRPADVQYVEAHGTGTLLGDPIEVQTLGDVLGEGRAPGQLCALGSVKTNIGHLESAAGVAGLIKVALSLYHRLLPPTLHFQEPNPHIPFAELPLRVQDALGPWGQPERMLVAGVSAFGFGGSNAHVVLSEAPPLHDGAPASESPDGAACLLPISAESDGALIDLARAYRTFLEDPEPRSLADVCFVASRHRQHQQRRLAVVGGSAQEVADKLDAFAAGESRPGMTSGSAPLGGRPRIAYVFSGYGAQWWGMGRELLESEPVFRDALVECDRLLQQHGAVSILSELRAGQSESRLASAHLEVTQPALFALQVALAALWRSWGIAPDVVVGHSLGETAAACVAGVLSPGDAARVSAERARVMYDALRQYPGRGAMAAVELSFEEASDMLGAWPDLSIAAQNGPTALVLSGEAPALEQVLATLRARGVFCRTLHAPGAGHSPVVETPRQALVAALAGLESRAGQVPMISTVTGETAAPGLFDAEYWGRNMRDTVRFAGAMDRLAERGVDVFLEIGPHPILSSAMAECLRHRGHTGRIVPSLRRSDPERATMLGSLGALYASGVPVNWPAVYPSGRRVTLPLYPWQRERYWLEATDDDSGHPARHPFLGRALASAQPSGERFWQRHLRVKEFPFLRDHAVGGRTLVPGTAYVEMVLAAASEFFSRTPDTLRRIEFRKALFLEDEESRLLQVVLSPGAQGEATVRIYGRAAEGAWTLHASADACCSAGEDQAAGDLDAIRSGCAEPVTVADYYEAFRAAGLDYGPAFQGVSALWRGSGEGLGRIDGPDLLRADAGLYHFHPALLDACLQTLATTVRLESNNGEGVGGLPVSIDEIRLYARPAFALWSHARCVSLASSDSRTLSGDISIFDEAGTRVGEVRGFRVRLLEAKSASVAEGWQDWLYDVRWPIAEPPADPVTPANNRNRWLLLADSGGIVEALAQSLRARGCTTVIAADLEGLDRCLTELASIPPGPLDVVHAWSLDAPLPDSTADWERAQALGCASAVRVIQALLPLERAGGTPRLWIVTQGSQAIGDVGASGVNQAPLWGLGRTIAQEHHSIWGGLVDLDPQATPGDNGAALMQTIDASDGEDQVAWRSGRRHVARLTPAHPLPANGRSAFGWRTDASYLITGGLGELGLTVARWMVGQGARRLILMSRTPLPERAEWNALPHDAPQARTVAAIRDLEAAGAAVHLAFVDVSDEPQIARFLAAFEREGWPRIMGVVHAAGVARLDPLAQMGSAQLADVLRPKTRGAWLLHRLLGSSSPLDFFVLFSSFSSLLSSPGLAHYAAANSFLDALAHHRRSLGLAALSMNWGAWGEVGMAARFLKSGRTPLPGVDSFSPDQALAALDHVLRQGQPAQVGLARVDWTRWRELYPTYMSAPFLSDVGRSAAAASQRSASEDRTLIRATVLAAAPAERLPLLEQYLRVEVGKVLGSSPSKVDVDRPFNTLGIDSLTAVELKNHIEADLRVSVQVVGFLQGRSVRTLADDLADQLAAAAAAPPPVVDPDDAAAALSLIDQLSDEQVDTLLGELQAEEQA